MTETRRWSKEDITQLFEKPFLDLMYQAHSVHRQHFTPNQIQLSTLLSIKTGACPEDCAYCPQSGHFNTGLKKEKLMDVDTIVTRAKEAKAKGSTRFCMGAAWRNVPKKAMPQVQEIIRQVKELGLETCMTLGMLTEEDAGCLKEAGLDYYNHNLDSSPEYYEKIITTRTYQDRLDTLDHVRKAKIKVCCGGIVGMGETFADRVGLIYELSNLPTPPESVPINQLIPIPGTPLAEQNQIEPFDFIRTIAVCRITMPTSYVRLSAGREDMSAEMQAWCFFAGANSIFYGEKLLTADNPRDEQDQQLLAKLGISTETLAQPETADA